MSVVFLLVMTHHVQVATVFQTVVLLMTIVEDVMVQTLL
jgi:hypothetical protein